MSIEMFPALAAHLSEAQKAEQARMQEYSRLAGKVEEANREMVLAYAWLLCSCRPWFEPGNSDAPQAGCVVHGNMLITVDGRVL